MHIQTDRALLPSGAPAVRYLQVAISAPPARAAAPRRLPAEVSLVLDRSGSMGGTKIAMARKAVDHAIRLLKPQDHLAVVCYDQQVDTVLSRTPATAEAKRLAQTRLAEIDARGSTDLEGGWTRGAGELREGTRGDAGASPGEHRVRRVLLLTDGLANHGVIDHQELAATAARLRTEGIATSTFGVGADFDEELLSRLATEGGGHFYFIEQAQQIPDFFASELGETLEIVARDVTFEVVCGPGVEAALINDLPVERADGQLRVRLGDLVADQQIDLIVAVTVSEPPAIGSSVTAQCRVSDRDHVLFAEPMAVDWRVADAAEHDAQPVNQDVIRAVATMLAERARGMALRANRGRAFDDARRIVRDMVDQLRALAPGDRVVEAVIAKLEEDEAQFAAVMDPIAMKQQHFIAYSRSSSRDAEGQALRRKES